MKRLVKIFAITSVLGISFLAFANKENSSDEKIATNEICDTQFSPGQPQDSTTENEQKIKICSRF